MSEQEYAPCRSCGHSAAQHDDNGKCQYEYWDDGQWYEGDCSCVSYIRSKK